MRIAGTPHTCSVLPHGKKRRPKPPL